MQEIEITMLGPSQVGKTSLLASMYYSFDSLIDQTDLVLEAENEDLADRLREKFRSLSKLPNNFTRKGGKFIGIERTTEHIKYGFYLGTSNGVEHDLTLKVLFHDYPGELIEYEGKFVREKLQHCLAILIAIDTPALMESFNGDPFLHETHNSPKHIADLFRMSYQDIKVPRLVILAPVRCEKYLQSEADSVLLHQRIKKGYKNLLSVLESFKDDDGKNLISVVITPVQTVGSSVFSHLKPMTDSNDTDFVFKRKSPDARFSPQDTEQPLRYVMRFLLARHLQYRRSVDYHLNKMDKASNIRRLAGALWNAALTFIGNTANWVLVTFFDYDKFWASFFGEALDFFSGNAELREALQEFASGSKKTLPFEVIQGQHLLEI